MGATTSQCVGGALILRGETVPTWLNLRIVLWATALQGLLQARCLHSHPAWLIIELFNSRALTTWTGVSLLQVRDFTNELNFFLAVIDNKGTEIRVFPLWGHWVFVLNYLGVIILNSQLEKKRLWLAILFMNTWSQIDKISHFLFAPLVPIRPHHKCFLWAIVCFIGKTWCHFVPLFLGLLAVDQAYLLAGVTVCKRCLRTLGVLELIEEARLAVQDVFCLAQDVYSLLFKFLSILAPQSINKRLSVPRFILSFIVTQMIAFVLLCR